LIQNGIPIIEAIQVNSGLEAMYLNYTTQVKE